MAGLLDLFGGLSPEQNQGLLAAAAQMLQASGSRQPVSLGAAAGIGIDTYQQTTREQRKQREAQERQAMQDAQAKAQAEQMAQMRELQMTGMRQSQGFAAEEAERAKLPQPAAPVRYSTQPEWVIGKDGKPQAIVLGTDGNPKVLDGIRPYVPPSRAAGGGGSRAASAPVDKPLPTTALKMLVTEEDALATAGNIRQRLAGIQAQIDGGKLDFGPLRNVKNQALNMMGTSTEESRNFASFKSTLEKLRNDSLRLNAGVQTDGDAQRAWNELFANITDKEYVKQRLIEIDGYNQEAERQRRKNISIINGNYGRTDAPAAGGATANPFQQTKPKNPPMKGQVKNGYRYIGGEPSDPASWEKI